MTRDQGRTLPKRLYKYRPFSTRTLEILVADKLFYADPSTFNDPLDSRPTLEPDIEVSALEAMLEQLVEQRVKAEMTEAAKALKYRGPKTLDHIARHSRRQAATAIENARYNATDPEIEVADPERFVLKQVLGRELMRRYDRGIVSLAERHQCPLMWSHYGDQHKGICIGYSVPDAASKEIHPMEYGGSRVVAASLVSKMLGGSESDRQKVDAAVLLRKAKPWGYEREWRLIGPRGERDCVLEMEEVIFGMRCPPSVQYAVIRALEHRGTPIKFYEIREKSDSFLLSKHPVDIEELASYYPRRSLTWAEMVQGFDDLDPLPSAET